MRHRSKYHTGTIHASDASSEFSYRFSYVSNEHRLGDRKRVIIA